MSDPVDNSCPSVLIVEDHRLFAESIRAALERSGMEVIAIATDKAQALKELEKRHPDIILMDIGLGAVSGAEFGAELLERHPDLKIVAVSALSNAHVVRDVVRAGFHGYITKDTPLAQFVGSINAALKGQTVIPYKLAGRMAGNRSEEEKDVAVKVAQLTPREREILALLMEGANSSEMARRLSVSANTVRTHVQNVLTKLQVHSRLEAAAFAIRWSVFEDDSRRYA